MASSSPYRNIARVIKTRGLEGKVHAQCAPDLPFCMSEGLRVHVVPPINGFPRQLDVVAVSDIDAWRCIVTFEQITSIDLAEQLVGHCLLALADDIEVNEVSALYGLVGRQVKDQVHGMLGSVTEIIETPANDVLVVSGPKGDVLIPLVEEVVLDIPEDESQPLLTKVMKGLIQE